MIVDMPVKDTGVCAGEYVVQISMSGFTLAVINVAEKRTLRLQLMTKGKMIGNSNSDVTHYYKQVL